MAANTGQLVLVGVLAAGIAGGVIAYRRAQLAPFVIRDYRAGASFSSLDEESLNENGSRFECSPVDVPGAGSVCTVRTKETPGTVALLVDSSQRAIVVRFVTSDAGLEMQREMRAVADKWRNVSIDRPVGYAASDGEIFEAMHWVSRDGRWSATIQMRHGADGLVAFTVRDEEALSRILQRTPLARIAYDAADLVNPLTSKEHFALVSVALREGGEARPSPAGGDDGAAADSGGTTSTHYAREAARLAENARSLPQCRARGVDTVGNLPATHRAPISDSAMSRAVELAFPGTRLELESGPYFVSPNGMPELVRLSTTLVDAERRVAVFGITFLRRIEQLSKTGDPSCRAPAQLVVARLTESNDVGDATALPLSSDAIASDIRHLEWHADPAMPGQRMVKVRVASSYATSQWVGEIDWEETVAVAPLRSSVRSPTSVSRKDVRGSQRSGQVRMESALDTVRVEVRGLRDGSSPFQRSLALPAEAGYLNGWYLLLSM